MEQQGYEDRGIQGGNRQRISQKACNGKSNCRYSYLVSIEIVFPIFKRTNVMKILVYTSMYYIGREKQNLTLVKELLSRGHHVIHAAPTTKYNISNKAISAFTLGG